jgi:hypothetical protein
MENFSLSDIAAIDRNNDGFGGGNAWVLIILFALIFGMGGFGGNNGNMATAGIAQGDLQRAIDLNSIQQGQASIAADIQRTTYESIGATKDAAYNNLSELRDVQAAVAAGFANQATCCCETNRNIDSLRFDMANYAAQTQQAIHAEGEATRAMMQQNKIESLQAQVNQLQLSTAMAGVVRYPMAMTYNAGNSCFSCCNCTSA